MLMLEQNKHQIWIAYDRGPDKNKSEISLNILSRSQFSRWQWYFSFFFFWKSGSDVSLKQSPFKKCHPIFQTRSWWFCFAHLSITEIREPNLDPDQGKFNILTKFHDDYINN